MKLIERLFEKAKARDAARLPRMFTIIEFSETDVVMNVDGSREAFSSLAAAEKCGREHGADDFIHVHFTDAREDYVT